MTKVKISELLDSASSEGITVEWVRMAPGFSGAADLSSDTIFLDWDLDSTPVDAVCVFMHEKGHLVLGHSCGQDKWGEQMADEWAARQLVDPSEYARVERLSHHVKDIAQELGVTCRIVEAYQRYLQGLNISQRISLLRHVAA